MEKYNLSFNFFKFSIIFFILGFSLNSCKVSIDLKTDVYETSDKGNSLKKYLNFQKIKTHL